MDERLDTTVCYRHPDRPTKLSCSRCGRPICAECSTDATVGQRCPECAIPTARGGVVQARAAWAKPSFQTAPVSFGIIAVTVAVFLIGLVSVDIDRWLLINWSQINIAVAVGEWWRIFTAALLHASPLHIGFNMYALYLFGPRLEQRVGSPSFAALYVASAGAGGAAAFVLIGPASRVPIIGASGAIFGLFGAWLYAAWKLRSSGGGAMFNQLLVLLAINLAFPLFIGNIAWQAHLGGLAGGFAIAWLWSRLAVGKPNAIAIRTAVALAVVAIAIAIVLVV